MHTDELDTIEEALGVRLPPAYRAAAVAGRLNQLLNADRASVVAINRAFRSGDFGDEDWPAHLYAFADDGAGNFFCLDLSTPLAAVFTRDHETLALVLEAENFESWLRCLEECQ